MLGSSHDRSSIDSEFDFPSAVQYQEPQKRIAEPAFLNTKSASDKITYGAILTALQDNGLGGFLYRCLVNYTTK